MTVSANTRQSDPFAGPQDAGHTFSFEFFLSDATMLEVAISTDGGDYSVVDPSDYTASVYPEQSVNPGGMVVYTPALASNETLIIRSNLTIEQTTDFTASATYNPRTIEDRIDYLVMCMQDLARKAGV